MWYFAQIYDGTRNGDSSTGKYQESSQVRITKKRAKALFFHAVRHTISNDTCRQDETKCANVTLIFVIAFLFSVLLHKSAFLQNFTYFFTEY